MASYVFGPVPSRRLGMSLGVDIIPAKTCTFNCIYCQVGRTTCHTLRRRAFFDSRVILGQIKAALRKKRKIDYVTFSGSGEPTLASNIGQIIGGVKEFIDTPVAVITNSSLIPRKSVQRDLLGADLLVPSLDAATRETFRKINRPFRGIRVSEIVRGLSEFRKRFRGQMWLEVMLVRGVNDMPAEIESLRKAIAEICPDKVHLNTVVRPPCEPDAKPLSRTALRRISRQIADDIPVEIVVPFKGKVGDRSRAVRKEVLSLLMRRSCTIEDIAAALGLNLAEAIKHAEFLSSTGKAQTTCHGGRLYYFVPSA